VDPRLSRAGTSISRLARIFLIVMPGLVPGIHVFFGAVKTWLAGTSPAMTTKGRAAVPQPYRFLARAMIARIGSTVSPSAL
jgi:hypothetical protein